jgi:hypothetical protein
MLQQKQESWFEFNNIFYNWDTMSPKNQEGVMPYDILSGMYDIFGGTNSG